MNLPPRQWNELRELVEAVCLGEITEQQAERLQELATASDEARQYYLEYTTLHAGIAWRFRDTIDGDVDGRSPAKRAASSALLPSLQFLGDGFTAAKGILLSSSWVSLVLLVGFALGSGVLVTLLVCSDHRRARASHAQP
jgi:hypothetical protein